MQNEPKRRKTSELLKVKQLIKVCEKNGIARIKYDNIEIEFNERKPKASKATGVKYESDSKYLDHPHADMPPDDVMMFAATDQFEHVLAERKAASKG